MEPSRNLLRRRQVEQKTGLPTAEIYRRVKDSEFPKPVKIGSRAVAWVESEIDDWIGERIAERDGAA